MMKMILFVAGLLVWNYTYGQLEMKVKEVVVRNLLLDSMDIANKISPSLKVVCSIENNTDTVQTLQLRAMKIEERDAEFTYCYYYQKEYKVSDKGSFPLTYVVVDGEVLYCEYVPAKYSIKPYEQLEVGSWIYILESTPVYKPGQTDYTLELLTILPTLKVIYKGPGFELEATEVKKVTIDPS